MNYDGMKKLSMEEVKKVELDLLITFDAFCKKHHLRYVLDGGTLIGAMRHQGFIPWDDDIDVAMPFPDFLKFKELYEKECSDSQKQLLYGKNNPYGFHYGKFVDKRTVVKSDFREDKRLYSVWVDIFPMYSIDDDDSIAQKKIDEILNYYSKTWLCLCTRFRNPFRKIFHLAFNDMMRKHYMNKIDNILFEHEYGSTNRIRCVPVVCKKLIPAKNDHFEKPITVTFEGYDFYAPRDYDEYLTRIYGDYMKLPPLDKRTSHSIEAYWMIDKSIDIT